MLSKEFPNYVVRYVSDELKIVLKESYGSINQGLRELYQIGVEIQFDEGKISSPKLQKLYQKIQNTHQLSESKDYEIIDFLVCFELGYKHKIAPILHHRKKLKLIYSGLIYAAHRFSNTRRCPQAKILISEEDINTKLLAAQNARWRCDFYKCNQIINSLEQQIYSANLGEHAFQYWTANIKDLKVESLFTVSDSKNYPEKIELSDEAIDIWGKQRNFIKLTHAYLRKAVLYRQKFLLDNGQQSSLFDVVETLKEAEKEVSQALKAQKNSQEAIHTLFNFYCEIAKSYAQISEFSLSWSYYYKASNKLNDLDDSASRCQLDLVRTRAVILSEQDSVRNLYEINRIESIIEEMRIAIERAEKSYSHDIVLREILVKDLIPLLSVVGKSGKHSFKEEARFLLFSCQEKALQLNLLHQVRGLKLIAHKFSL